MKRIANIAAVIAVTFVLAAILSRRGPAAVAFLAMGFAGRAILIFAVRGLREIRAWAAMAMLRMRMENRRA